MTSVAAIRKFIGESKPIKVQEFKALTKQERDVLGKMCCKALGEEWDGNKKKEDNKS
jgi:hypothetical protein